MRKIFVLAIGLLLSFSISAQTTSRADDPASTSTIVKTGVLNGKALSLPKPAYPEDAKKEGAEGPVSVMVTLDEEGNVIEAKAAAENKRSDDNGEVMVPVHPALMEASEKAARAAKFSPTMINGQPIKVKGVIVYNFVAGNGLEKEQSWQGVRGGVINDVAKYLPAPVYPKAALAVRASGAVAVQVVIDMEGKVISAAAISGHPLLRAAAVAAAKQAQFPPVQSYSETVKVSGVIVYNFAPPEEDR